MTIYPDEQKTSLIERMLPPQNADVPQFSKETGIPKDTLYGWRRQGLRTDVDRLRFTWPQQSLAGDHRRWNTGGDFEQSGGTLP